MWSKNLVLCATWFLFLAILIVQGFRFVFVPWVQSSVSQPWTELNSAIEAIDSGTYSLPVGQTIDRILLERDMRNPDHLVLRFTTRPLHPGERPKQRAVYLQERNYGQ
ncbi:MAG: hypothetical protein Q8P35_00015 [Candidatus Yanofskybacteria bacterium]|nr:hypothetical protein [Candidatus Yanofskybacteria bacterium]